MFKLCSTNSSWLQGLWKKADSHDSFQIRLASWRCFSSASRSTTVTPGSARSAATLSARAACSTHHRHGGKRSSELALARPQLQQCS